MKILFHIEGLEGMEPSVFILRPGRNAVSAYLCPTGNRVRRPVSWAGIRITTLLQMYAKHHVKISPEDSEHCIVWIVTFEVPYVHFY